MLVANAGRTSYAHNPGYVAQLKSGSLAMSVREKSMFLMQGVQQVGLL